MGQLNGSTQSASAQLEREWSESSRWQGIERPYSADDVVRLRGTVQVEYTLARLGAEKLWRLMHSEEFVAALGALDPNQAVQQVKAGLKAIYCSGWQVAAGANTASQIYPDQSLYPADSVPALVRRIQNGLRRLDQVLNAEGTPADVFAPILADAEAGFGGILNAHELMKGMIEAGASAVHFEDQLSSAKKCGHMGGKVLVPTQEAVHKLVAARLAADIYGVPTILVARTDANAATLLTSDVDPRDHEFLTGERTVEGFYVVRSGLDQAISRALSYAPYADMLWCETAAPNLAEATRFAEAIHARFPGKLLAYNCSPSFHWKQHLSREAIAAFQHQIAALGYKFQFITLAGYHALNHSMFNLARGFATRQMAAYVDLQEAEFAAEEEGYTATRHQREAGTGYFDAIAQVIAGEDHSLAALSGSTEEHQFGK